MSVSSDDLEKELDAEFRQILYMIKPYINDIDDHYRLEKYRVWLEKLSAMRTPEKLERNKYLVELANQIHDNVLKAPFTFNPPHGPLPKLKKAEVLSSDVADPRFEEEDEINTWPYLSTRPTRSNQSNQGILNRRQSRNKELSPHMRNRSNKLKMMPRPFQTIGRVADETSLKNSETSSWCDLSESATSVNIGCGDTDADEDERIARREDRNSKEAERPFSAGKTEDEKNRNREELEALKLRMKDLIDVKNALKDTHVLSEDRKKTIDNLQNRVTMLEKENVELKGLLESQQKKFVELDKIKTKELDELKRQFKQVQQEKFQEEFNQKLRQHQRERIQNIEKYHASKISLVESEYNAKIENFKNEYDERIKQITESSAQILNEKEAEIHRLKNELKNRGDASNNEENNEQIIQLKRCLSKLDKALHKNEKDYVKRIEKLKQELEMREMTNKMQLQTQRADMLVKCSASKQKELRNALDSLEEKYKSIIENIQTEALESKRHDEMVIQQLKLLLEKHNISF